MWLYIGDEAFMEVIKTQGGYKSGPLIPEHQSPYKRREDTRDACLCA